MTEADTPNSISRKARDMLGLVRDKDQQFLRYRTQHVHDYPAEYSLGEYSVGEIPKSEVQQRLVPKECQRVHKLTARTGAQWVAGGLGVIAIGASVFTLLAVVNQDEKFHREVIQPVRSYIQGSNS